ncbi:MAG: carbohydrate kinase [Candidatus Acidiferrum sp.]|jgi:fructokinase
MKKFTTVGLGELLWDIFPEGRQLGGAPANFAYMTNLLGDEGVVASRVGDDALGEDARRRLEHLGLNTSYIQLDSERRTGVAQVEVDANGQPTFRIAAPVAWDYFEWTPAWQTLAQLADAVCFGSLAQRSAQSRETTYSFLNSIRTETTRVFDVNLRQSFYSAQILADFAKLADIIKLNNDELPTVVQLLGFPFHDQESAAEWLLHTFRLKLVCITRGARGSLLVSEYAKHQHAGIPVTVADTVGSGDAFTAALVYHYLRRDSLSTMNEAANRMGSWVASQIGATPARDESQLARIRSVSE